jgi:hypothetical protein
VVDHLRVFSHVGFFYEFRRRWAVAITGDVCVQSLSKQREMKTMGTTELIILIVVLVLLFGGGGGYYWSRGR